MIPIQDINSEHYGIRGIKPISLNVSVGKNWFMASNMEISFDYRELNIYKGINPRNICYWSSFLCMDEKNRNIKLDEVEYIKHQVVSFILTSLSAIVGFILEFAKVLLGILHFLLPK